MPSSSESSEDRVSLPPHVAERLAASRLERHSLLKSLHLRRVLVIGVTMTLLHGDDGGLEPVSRVL
jgi:hypothetical protein